MGLANVALLAVGVALLAVAALRVRGPYRRYMALRTQERNLSRYDSWRGGHRGAEEMGPSSAALMQAELRRQAQRWMAIGGIGLLLLFLGFWLA